MWREIVYFADSVVSVFLDFEEKGKGTKEEKGWRNLLPVYNSSNTAPINTILPPLKAQFENLPIATL
jgi:hypothetical protein